MLPTADGPRLPYDGPEMTMIPLRCAATLFFLAVAAGPDVYGPPEGPLDSRIDAQKVTEHTACRSG